MKQLVIIPGGFHPFHAGHAALYQSAQAAFPGADVYVAATNDTSQRPFPFAIKEKLAKLAGVEAGHFVQVKSPFRAEEIVHQFDPNDTQLIFVRSEKDANKPPQGGGTKKDGSPSYLQPLGDDIQPLSQHAYMAYLPTVEFGPGMTSATEIRGAWPNLNEKRKTALVMSLYPATQKNPKLAATVVKMLDTAMGAVDESALGDLPRPNKRNQFKSLHRLRKQRGLDEQGVAEGLDEAFDQPYPMAWEKSEADDSMDALARLPDGSNLSIMFNMEYDEEGEEVIQVEFHRNNSQAKTGEGDQQRVFATVLSAIQTFIKKYKPNKITFSASKEVEPDDDQRKALTRARLYDSLVQRYARAWGYRAFRADNGNIVIYELGRIQPVAESTDNMNFEEGDCPIFAIALHRLSKLPLMALIEYDEQMGSAVLIHAYVKLDNKWRIDATGETDVDWMLQKYPNNGNAEEIEISEKDLIKLGYGKNKCPTLQQVLPHAKEVLQTIDNEQGVTEGEDFDRCFDQACKLYDRAVSKNLEPKLVQVADFQGDGNGADPRWMKLPQHVWQHYVVIVGDQVLDPTAKQFGDSMPTQYKVSDLDRLWGKQYQIRPRQGVAEGLDEAVGGNYLYHATSASGLKAILSSGGIRSAASPQSATSAQTRLPTVSVTRDWGYASGAQAQSQSQGGIGRDAILVLDRNAVESNFKTLGTSQSTNIKGLAFNPYLTKNNVARSQNTDPMARNIAKAKAKNAEPTAKAGGEFEEAVVVPKGALPLKGTMVGFWINPKSELMKDPAIMNDPRRLDMPRPNQFVKATKQGVAEGLDEAFDQPYPMAWEKSEADDSMDALARLPDGSNLSIMFNMEYDEEGEEVIQVEFHRNNSQEVTGDGDAQKVFATVLSAIQQFIVKYTPLKIYFSASKEPAPMRLSSPAGAKANPESRAKLYDRLVMRYARTWGYRPLRADTGSIVRYELSRLKPVQGVAEGWK